MILFAQNIYILMLMKVIGQLLKTQKITVKRVIKKNTQGGKRIGSGRKKANYKQLKNKDNDNIYIKQRSKESSRKNS